MSTIAIVVAKLLPGLRVSPEVVRGGLDLGEHGERAYNYEISGERFAWRTALHMMFLLRTYWAGAKVPARFLPGMQEHIRGTGRAENGSSAFQRGNYKGLLFPARLLCSHPSGIARDSEERRVGNEWVRKCRTRW